MLSLMRKTQKSLALLPLSLFACVSLTAPIAQAQETPPQDLTPLPGLSSDWTPPQLSKELFDSIANPEPPATTPAPPTTTPAPDPQLTDVVPDPDFRRYLNLSVLGRTETPDAPISAADMAKVTDLTNREIGKPNLLYIPDENGETWVSCGVRCGSYTTKPDLEGLQYATNLRQFAVANFSRLPVFKTFPQLTSMHLDSDHVSNYEGLTGEHFPALTNLRIDNRQAEVDISSGMNTLTSLKKLEVTMFKVEELPGGITDLPALEELILFTPSIKELPAEFGNLTSLRSFTFRGYENASGSLRSIPETIGNLSNLEHLQINFQGAIKAIPESIGDLQKLEVLDLTGSRNLSEIPDSLFTLPNLKELRMTHAAITELSPKIIQLQKLEILDVWAADLTALPVELLELPNLKAVGAHWMTLGDDPVYKELRERGIGEPKDRR